MENLAQEDLGVLDEMCTGIPWRLSWKSLLWTAGGCNRLPDSLILSLHPQGQAFYAETSTVQKDMGLTSEVMLFSMFF